MAQAFFQDIAREWWTKYMLRGNQEYAHQVWRNLERDVMPEIGQKPLDKIDAPMILSILRRVEARGTIETAHKMKAHISQVMRYGIACGLTYSNPARDLSWALTPRSFNPRAAITEPRAVGKLAAAIERMTPGVRRCALKLLALTFVRSGELRQAEWTEIAMDTAEWRIPAAKMKMKRPHIVPLSRQAQEVLRELRGLCKSERWLFPAMRRHDDRPMTSSVFREALRRLGYSQTEMCPHGFRAMAATLLSEQGWASDTIERQLAHADRNQVRAAYQRSELLTDRRAMMQAWADFLDMRCAWAILGR
jgi:integrase